MKSSIAETDYYGEAKTPLEELQVLLGGASDTQNQTHPTRARWGSWNNFPLFGQIAYGESELKREVVFQRALTALRAVA